MMKTLIAVLSLAAVTPLVASHSSCRALSGHPRNMTDDMIRALGGGRSLSQ